MTLEELTIAIRVQAEDAEDGLEAVADGLAGMAKTGDASLSRVQRSLRTLTRDLGNVSAIRRQTSAYQQMIRKVKDAGGGWADLGDEVKGFARSMGVAEGDVDGAVRALAQMQAQTEAAASAGDFSGLLGSLTAMRDSILAIPPAQLTADASQALGEINALIALINLFLSLAGQAGVSTASAGGRRGGGGGGGGRSSAQEAAASARAAEQAQEDAYRAALTRIEHRRHLNQITAREELAQLEQLRRTHARTAEQIMEIDERIYDARRALREAEEEKITTLHDAMTDALRSRYEAQREIEQRRIEESVRAWESWSDATCAAIQKQIDALDAQEQAEDRDAQRAQHERQIAALAQAIDYETDAYNRGQLQRELEEAERAWADVQRDWAREDERAALEAQMLAVQEKAQQELARLDGERARIDEVYDRLTQETALAAEAQKLLMEGSQQEMLALLAAHAPDYEATGRTLGERLYAGFAAAVGDIEAWFSQLDARFEAMAEGAQHAALQSSAGLSQQAAAQVQAPVINQTVNFNQPVESPADVSRRMQQVSEGLAAMM